MDSIIQIMGKDTLKGTKPVLRYLSHYSNLEKLSPSGLISVVLPIFIFQHLELSDVIL